MKRAQRIEAKSAAEAIRAGAKLLSGLGGLKPPQIFFRLLQNFRLAPPVFKRSVKLCTIWWQVGNYMYTASVNSIKHSRTLHATHNAYKESLSII